MIRFEPQHFKMIEDFIAEYSGILLERVPKQGVSERIRKHIESTGFNKIEDYFQLLQNPGSLSLRDELMSLVTVNESFFFRNPIQFKFLAKTLLPKVYERKIAAKLGQISMWSAGCSTGEEAYSLAYIGSWFARQHPGIRLHILGTDLNTSSVEKARRGIFRKRSIRNNYEPFLEEFKAPFAREHRDGFEIFSELKDIILFKFMNLRDLKSLKAMNRLDVIFCRNVLIYFADQFKRELLATFHDLLHPEGYLFLGETESLPTDVKGFELVNCKGAFCYQKTSSGSPKK